MAVNGVEKKINLPEVKIEPKKVQAQVVTAEPRPVVQNDTKQNEIAVQSFFKKESLNRLFDANFVNGQTTANAPAPLDYFEVDKQADELIKNHTSSNIFGSSLNTDALGRDLAGIAKTDPQRAAALSDNVLDKIADSDRDEVAQSMVDSMSAAELRTLARDPKGKETLEQMKSHLLTGAVWGNERATASRIDAAVKAAEFQNSAEFQRLSPETQREVLSRVDANEGNAAAVDNLLDLARNADFASLPPATQNWMLTAFDGNKEDRLFVDALKQTAANGDFRSLNAAQQAVVVADVEKFATTESYRGKPGGIFGIGERTVGEDDKRYMLGLVAGTSVYSQQHPSITSVRNSLDKVLSGQIRMESYSESGTVNGWAADNTIHMNRLANSTRTIDQQLDTFVHEINHIVNGDTGAGTPERFLDEYRARVVGREAGGRSLSETIQRSSLDQLTTRGGTSYGHLNNLYRDNPKFKAVIDGVYADLNKTPPVLTTPEQLRQRLVAAGFSSDYLNTPTNLDNH